MRRLFLVSCAVLFCSVHAESSAESVDELLRAARTALAKGATAEAFQLAEKAVRLDERDVQARAFRGSVCEALGKNQDALADYTKAIALDPKAAAVFSRRGAVHFKLGQFKESVADFDQCIALQPAEGPRHWMRGISCYYAGLFEEGKRQFVGYETVDANDVENAVWHTLCNARLVGVEKARAAILKVGSDRRVPMAEVYGLFQGTLKPEQVLAAAKEGRASADELNRRLFYAHLYLGLYFETGGDKKRSLEHLTRAREHRINHYMWDVARVHEALLRKEMGDK